MPAQDAIGAALNVAEYSVFICRNVFIASISGVRNDKKTYRLYSQGIIG